MPSLDRGCPAAPPTYVGDDREWRPSTRHRGTLGPFLLVSLSRSLAHPACVVRARATRRCRVESRAWPVRVAFPFLSRFLPFPSPSLLSSSLRRSSLLARPAAWLLRTVSFSPSSPLPPVSVGAPRRTASRAREQQVRALPYALNVAQEADGAARTMGLGRLVDRRRAVLRNGDASLCRTDRPRVCTRVWTRAYVRVRPPRRAGREGEDADGDAPRRGTTLFSFHFNFILRIDTYYILTGYLITPYLHKYIYLWIQIIYLVLL